MAARDSTDSVLLLLSVVRLPCRLLRLPCFQSHLCGQFVKTLTLRTVTSRDNDIHSAWVAYLVHRVVLVFFVVVGVEGLAHTLCFDRV